MGLFLGAIFLLCATVMATAVAHMWKVDGGPPWAVEVPIMCIILMAALGVVVAITLP